MAKYKNGINGRVSGKVGTVVAASWRGIDYLRSKPIKRGKVKVSVAQRNQRLRFALVSGWLQPLRDLIWVGYQFYSGSKTPMNGCIGYHLRHALLGQGEECCIDLAKAVFSRGELLAVLIRQFRWLDGGLCVIQWESASFSPLCNPDDEVVVILYNAARKRFVTFSKAAVRADGRVVLKVPDGFSADQVHCYLHLLQRGGEMVSTTVYGGLLEAYL